MAASGVVLRTFRFAELLFCRVAASGVVLRTFRFAPSLPRLRRGPRPLTAAGGQGPSGQHRLRPKHIRSIPPTPCGIGPARLRPRVARVLRATPLAPCIHRAPSPAYRATLRFTLRAAKSFFDFWPPLSHCFNQCRSGIKDVPLEVLYAPTCASLASWPQNWPCPCSWHHIQGTCQSRRYHRCGS